MDLQECGNCLSISESLTKVVGQHKRCGINFFFSGASLPCGMISNIFSMNSHRCVLILRRSFSRLCFPFLSSQCRSPPSFKTNPSLYSAALSCLSPLPSQQSNYNKPLVLTASCFLTLWTCFCPLPQFWIYRYKSPMTLTSLSPLAFSSLEVSHSFQHLTLLMSSYWSLFLLLALMRMLHFLVFLLLLLITLSLLNYMFLLPVYPMRSPELNLKFLPLPFLSSP